MDQDTGSQPEEERRSGSPARGAGRGDRPRPGGARPKDPPEGVRIIGADEAAEAIERGDVVRRRGDDMPRFGDRPAPPPEGPRPTLRFPLSGTVDPTAVERPPVVPPPAPAPPSGPVGSTSTRASARRQGPVPVPDQPDDLDDLDDPDATGDLATVWEDDLTPGAPMPDEDEDNPFVARPTSGSTPLPHWTEPPTGEVPRILADQPAADDDLAAWSSFATSGGPRWRDQSDDWEDADFDPTRLADDDEIRLGALDPDRPSTADLYDFDEPAAPPARGERAPAEQRRPARDERARRAAGRRRPGPVAPEPADPADPYGPAAAAPYTAPPAGPGRRAEPTGAPPGLAAAPEGAGPVPGAAGGRRAGEPGGSRRAAAERRARAAAAAGRGPAAAGRAPSGGPGGAAGLAGMGGVGMGGAGGPTAATSPVGAPTGASSVAGEGGTAAGTARRGATARRAAEGRAGGGRGATPGGPGRTGGPIGRDVPVAIAVGVLFAAVALVLFRLGAKETMVLVTAVLVVAAAEFYTASRQGGHQPAVLLGIAATGAMALAAYWRGEAAYPLVIFLTVVFGLLWHLVGAAEERPVGDLGVTLLGVAYVGGLGSFAALLLKFPNGVGMLLGAVIAAVAYDVGGYAVGRNMGRTPLAPNISPNKTWEGLVGGILLTVVATTLIMGRFPGVHPFDELGDALKLGLVAAVAAPLGDLCESMLKRDLGVKDMGAILPGHGGLLDRFDALLFVLPATYYLVRLLDLV